MCAKVKAEVQNIAHELVVSGLDSATSLIQVKLTWVIHSFIPVTLGGEKFDELCRLHRQIVVRGIDQIQESWHAE